MVWWNLCYLLDVMSLITEGDSEGMCVLVVFVFLWGPAACQQSCPGSQIFQQLNFLASLGAVLLSWPGVVGVLTKKKGQK